MFKGFQDKGFSGIKACFFRTKRTFWVNAIDPDKDVDGFHTVNAGRLMIGGEESKSLPCTTFKSSYRTVALIRVRL